MRTEHDFLGEMNVPDNVYYGVQTMRAMENFHITGEHLDLDFIQAMAIVKKAAALANMETGRLDKKIGNALVQAASEIIDGQWLDQFPVDPIQGGAGTSVNMNMNEVLCNRALEIIGKEKGRYDIISPNNHANMAQSTNDVFPTSIKVCLSMKGKKLTEALKELETELDVKADEFKDVIKMGRTHLQDAVPITLGQEMGAYASAVARGRKRISRSLEGVHVINMGGTAVGTGLNAEPAYIKAVATKLSMLTGDIFVTARNLIDMTNNTDIFAEVSGNMKATALMLIKMANDFRLMASGPRCGPQRIEAAGPSARFFHHAGQSQSGHGRSPRPDVLPDHRQRHGHQPGRRKRPVRIERHGTGHGLQPLPLHAVFDQRYPRLRQIPAQRRQGQQRSLPVLGRPQRRHRHGPLAAHRL